MVAFFSLEQIVNGLRKGFVRTRESRPKADAGDHLAAPNSVILAVMTVLFLALVYLGVPVAFALTAGVMVGWLLTPITLQSIVGQMFNGIDLKR